MHGTDFARMIAPTVMAAGKAGDRVNMCQLQALLPELLVKTRANPVNGRRSVKIKMHLAKTKFMLVAHAKIPSIVIVEIKEYYKQTVANIKNTRQHLFFSFHSQLSAVS